MKKTFAVLFIIFLLISCGGDDGSAITDGDGNGGSDTPANGDEEVKFADPNLENCVRKKLGKETGILHVKDVLELTYLECIYKGEIKDLDGIEKLLNLEQLHLNGNSVTDISVLQHLKKLQYIDLSGNEISDISTIGNLKELEILYLNECYKLDLSNLKESDFNSVKQFTIKKSELKSINGLECLKNVEWINLSNNQIEDITPLKNLKTLKNLYLTSNLIRSAEPLVGLVNLENLSVGENCIEDLSPLEELLKNAPNLDSIGGDVEKRQMGEKCTAGETPDSDN